MTELVGKRDGLARLVEMQEEELASIESKINLWKQYKSDYVALKSLINEMKDRVRHPFRIPIAGRENYFALRSSKQATEMIDRRLENIKDSLKKSEDAKRKTEDWLKAATEHKKEKEEFVEIIETM